MFIIDTNTKLHYRFNDVITTVGTLGQLEDVAQKLNLQIDYAKLAEDNGIPNEYYESEREGVIKVTEMATEHLRNALLKQLRNYYTRENFKDITDADFFKYLEDPDIYNSEIKMLYSELSDRID